MSVIREINWLRLTDDGLVCQGPAYFEGYTLRTSSDGGYFEIYEGQDTSSGKLVSRFKDLNAVMRPIMFPNPIKLSRGIYVDIGTAVTAVTIFWSRPDELTEAE